MEAVRSPSYGKKKKEKRNPCVGTPCMVAR
jgi:hypothetical protein